MLCSGNNKFKIHLQCVCVFGCVVSAWMVMAVPFFAIPFLNSVIVVVVLFTFPQCFFCLMLVPSIFVRVSSFFYSSLASSI